MPETKDMNPATNDTAAGNQKANWPYGEARHLWMPYCQMKTAANPLWVERTERDEIILRDGRRLVDGIASWWTACHGYNHPHLVEAIVRQTQQLPHVMMGGLCHDQARQLGERLASLLPGDLDRVFFCDSGSVAVEVAMKIAVQYWHNRGQKQRCKFVGFRDGYHGDTTGAMSLCDPIDSMHALFQGLLLEQHSVNLPSTDEEFVALEALLAEHHADIAAVIIEPLAQMAGGILFHSPATLRNVYDLAQRYEVLLIADEIATGFGRTGSLFAVNQSSICPDIICLGKALTGGMLTLAGVAARDTVYDAFHDDDCQKALMHGPTFMGNPLACAAANASLDLFETEPRLEQAKAIETRFESAVRECSAIGSVHSARSLGAIFAISFSSSIRRDVARDFFVERNVWLRPIGKTLYACPPLNIDLPHLDQVIDCMRSFAEAVAESPTRFLA